MLSDSDCLADRHRGFPWEKGGEVMEAAPTAPVLQLPGHQVPALPHLYWLEDNCVANHPLVLRNPGDKFCCFDLLELLREIFLVELGL